jgi:hypothetical protein
MMQSEQINELAAALAKAQGAMENAAKNKSNPHFKSTYADLAAVLDAIRTPLSNNGLSTVQTMEIAERCIVLRTTLLHSSGQFIATEYPIAVGLKPQEMGSSITYGRRYSLAAIVGIAQDDDDANAAAKTSPPVVTPSKISPKELTDLLELINSKETSAEMVCKHFKFPSLADITTDKLATITTAIKAKPDRQYEEAAE